MTPFHKPSGLLAYFAGHRTAANLLLVLMLVAGAFAVTKIRSQFFPDVVVDSISVRASWDGAGPEDIDKSLVGVLEPSLLAIDGVTEVTSVSREGSARISMEFEPDWDMDTAEKDVADAVEAITNLPDDVDTPRVSRDAWRDRVTSVVISGPTSLSQIGLYADEFTARLFAGGITRTSIQGFSAPELLVEVPQVKLIEHHLTLSEIASVIEEASEANPAGDLGAGQRLRTGVEKRSIEDLAQLPLRSTPDGAQLLLGEVATLTALGPGESLALLKGENPAVSIRVDRSQSGDAIRMQTQVEDIARSFEATLPPGMTVELTETRAEIIVDRLDILLSNGLTGLVLVLILLFLFLSFRTAFWVAAGIPVAMISTIGIMYATGLTINMVSLFALIICLGIVVDDAIVVGEHADYRFSKLGESPLQAAVNAAQRMAGPVIAASITTIIAFSALTLIGGRLGRMVLDIPYTVIAVLVASLVECFLILPAHMHHAISAQERPKGNFFNLFLALSLIPAILGFLASVVENLAAGHGFAFPALSVLLRNIVIFAGVILFAIAVLPKNRRADLLLVLRGSWFDLPSLYFGMAFEWFTQRMFRPFMRLVLILRYPVLAGAVLLLVNMVMLFQSGAVSWQFFSPPERNSATGNIAMMPGATRADTAAMVAEMQRATRAVGAQYEDQYGTNPIIFVMGQIGGSAGRGLSGSETKDADQLGAVSLEIIDSDQRPYSASELISAIETETARHPLLETLSFRGGRFGSAGDAIEVKFYGADAGTLKEASLTLQDALSEYPEVSALEDSLSYDKSELVLELTPLGKALGFSIDDVGLELRRRLNGITAAEFPDGSRTAKITVQLPDSELTADFLQRTRLPTSGGQYVPLSDIVSAQEQYGFSQVRRENGLRVVTVSGDISEDDPDRAAEISEEIQSKLLPQVSDQFGVSFYLGGLAEQEREFLSDAILGLILCLTGIYITLCWIFASWFRPLVIMIVIPFGLIGAIWGHYTWGVALSMFSVVGLIGMAGIIINDSIVLITTIDGYAKTRGLIPAILDATVDRLRAVLLTTLTTVLGLAPLLYETSSQTQFLRPTVLTLAYGLGFGMILVLLVTPGVVAVQHDLGRLIRATKRSLLMQHKGPIPAAAILRGAFALIFALIVGLYGPLLMTGALPFELSLGAMPPAMAALAITGAGSALICLCAFTLALIWPQRKI